MQRSEITSLEQMLAKISQSTEGRSTIMLGTIFDVIGRRSFGPILLFAGLITAAPVVGDIPGVPTIMGALVMLVAVQLLFHREYFWFPKWVLRRSVSTRKLNMVIRWSRKPAQTTDRFMRARFCIFIGRTATYMAAIICIWIALAMPAMELVPFSANFAGLALIAFGLSLITRDGLVALFAFVLTAGLFASGIWFLL